MADIRQLIEVEAREFSAAMRKFHPPLGMWVDARLGEGFTVQAIKDALAVSTAVTLSARKAPAA